MKNTTIAVAVLTLSLAACGNKKDMPTAEQVAKAYEMHMNANLVPELGQRIEIRGWDDLEVDCSASGPDRVTCVTGGTVDMVGFHGGKQLKPEPVPVPAQFDFTFAKQGNAWVPISAKQKTAAANGEPAAPATTPQAQEKVAWPASPDGYRELHPDDLAWVLASRLAGQISDENLAQVFVDGYSHARDAFAKQDLLKAKLPAVKERLANLAKTPFFRISYISKERMVGKAAGATKDDFVHGEVTVNDYDFQAKAFPFFSQQCLMGENYGSPVYEERGMRFRFVPWGRMQQPACQLKVEDEGLARRIEQARTKLTLQTRETLYFRLTGERSPGGEMLAEAHRMDLALFETTNPYSSNEGYTPLAEFTLTAPPAQH